MPRPFAVVVLSRWPFPIKGGRERVLDQHLKFLAATYELVVLCRENVGETPSYLARAEIATVRKAGFGELLINLLVRRLPLQESFYCSSEAARRLQSYVRSYNPTVVFIDMVRNFAITRLLDPLYVAERVVLDFDDILSRRYAEWTSARLSHPLGSRRHDFPPVVRIGARLAAPALVALEARLIRRRERFVANKVRVCMFTSPVEAAAFEKDVPGSRAVSIPLVSDRAALPEIAPGKPRLVFIGNLKNHHNVSALRALVSAIEFADSGATGVKIDVMGDFDPDDREILELGRTVRLCGYADSLEDIARVPSILLAPFPEGTGLKTKVFDCMVHGIVVVTTARGIDGFAFVPGRDLIVCDDVGALYREGLRLQRDWSRFMAIRSSAWHAVRSRHSKEIVFDHYRQTFTAHPAL